MKKIMWIVAVLPVVVASMMLQVIPDMILATTTGSKYDVTGDTGYDTA